MRVTVWFFCLLLVADAAPPQILSSSYQIRNMAIGGRSQGASQLNRIQVAVFRTEFDQHLYVNGTIVKHRTYTRNHTNTWDSGNIHMRGLTRLDCANEKQFPSHPPIEGGQEQAFPTHLMPLVEVPDKLHELISLFDTELDTSDAETFVSILILSYEPYAADSEPRGFVNLPLLEVPNCRMRFLDESSQTWFGSGLLSNYNYQAVDDKNQVLRHHNIDTCGQGVHSLPSLVRHYTFRAVEYAAHLERNAMVSSLVNAEPACRHCQTRPSLLPHVDPYVTVLPTNITEFPGTTSFFEYDIAESNLLGESAKLMECMALDQQQRLAEDLSLTVQTKFLGALIQICTVPIAGFIIPILCTIALLIMAIPIALLIIAVLTPYIEPLFAKMEKGSNSPYMQMMMTISPVYYKLWGVKKRRMTRLSAMLGTGILTPFMKQGSDGSGGWGPLIMLIFGAIMANIHGLYERAEVKIAAMIPKVVTKLLSLLVPAAIGNFMCGPLAAKVVKSTVAQVTHNVVHNSNYALTHSLTQSVTQAVTEAMHKQERHYYYCLLCYYQGKYCDFCSTYNQYASAGKNLNNLSSYPGQ